MSSVGENQEVHVDGHCYCGKVTYEVRIPAEAKPLFTAYCHCQSCRRAHAAPLYHVAAVDKSMFSVTAGKELLREFGHSPSTVHRVFCSNCGSKIYNHFPEWQPGGRTPIAFFPDTLAMEHQRALPEKLRAKKHAFREQTVLDEAMLGGFFQHS